MTVIGFFAVSATCIHNKKFPMVDALVISELNLNIFLLKE